MTDATPEPATPCPRCGRPTSIYYDDRNTWDGCARCRVRWWTEAGHSDATGFNPPPAGAIPAPMGLYSWAEIAPPK